MTKKHAKGLRGWLILIGIGILINPIIILNTLISYSPRMSQLSMNMQYYELEAKFAIEDGITYHFPNDIIFMNLSLKFSLFFYGIMLIASIYLIYLFFTRHHYFPMLFIGIIILLLGFILLDDLVLSDFFTKERTRDTAYLKFMGLSFISIITISYTINSKRVQATFAKKQRKTST